MSENMKISFPTLFPGESWDPFECFDPLENIGIDWSTMENTEIDWLGIENDYYEEQKKKYDRNQKTIYTTTQQHISRALKRWHEKKKPNIYLIACGCTVKNLYQYLEYSKKMRKKKIFRLHFRTPVKNFDLTKTHFLLACFKHSNLFLK